MSQPDLLSEQIEALRGALFAGRSPVTIERDALIVFDGLVADLATQARNLEARIDAIDERCQRAIAGTAAAIERAEELRSAIVQQRPLPLDRVVAELDAETRATNAFAASIERTKDRIVQMRAAQDLVTSRENATEKAIMDGVEAGKVALFPIVPRPVFGPATQTLFGAMRGDVSVETAVDFFAMITRDAPKSRFSDAPTFDTPEDCA